MKTVSCNVCGEPIKVVKWFGMNGKLKSATHYDCLGEDLKKTT